MDEKTPTGPATAPTSPPDFADVPLPYPDDAGDDHGHPDATEDTPEATGACTGSIAPGITPEATEGQTVEPTEDAVRPSGATNTPNPHTGSDKAPKGRKSTSRRQREASSAATAGLDNDQRALAAAQRARTIAADFHATGDPMRTVAARHGVGVGTVSRAVKRYPAPETSPEDAA
ncbi:hypothetical protein [Corynebacterium variabile]|nr:hypothetical protein [Corynebacterium variabile]